MKKIKQVNKWVIKKKGPNDVYYTGNENTEYCVFSPTGVCFQDNLSLKMAEEFCGTNLDFVKKKVVKSNIKKYLTGERCLVAVGDDTDGGFFKVEGNEAVFYRDRKGYPIEKTNKKYLNYKEDKVEAEVEVKLYRELFPKR